MNIIFNQVVELVKPTLISSPYSSEPVEDWDNPTFEEVGFRVSVQPENQSEGPVERPQTVTGWVMITPPGTDIPALEAGAKVRLGGVMVMDVVGQPARWPNPWEPGEVHHLEAKLEVVNG